MTRKKAMEILVSQRGESADLTFFYIRKHVKEIGVHFVEEEFTRLKNLGLVTDMEITKTTNRRWPKMYKYTLSEEGKKYVRGDIQNNDFAEEVNVAKCIYRLLEVTGFTYLNAAKTQAQVEYVEICERTPFGEAIFRRGKAVEDPQRKNQIVRRSYYMMTDGELQFIRKH
jgi:hypothetical protein